ncbi:AmmeMemoRadiSam system radical SAM enzyme [Pirellulaceae bacterium SH501]
MKIGKWWHREESEAPDSSGLAAERAEHREPRIQCDLCPRECRMKEGDRGFCFVRKVQDGQMVLDTYGKSTGFCVDPIEKKPLHHFYPGTSVLSFGTAGCNLGCQFCQNWDISKSREVERLSSLASPEAIAAAAKELGCRSVAFTYNDPVIWAEYAIDTAIACHDLDIKTVAVTAGYIQPEARREFFQHMDATNIDLKAFSEDFYRKITYSHLEPVLDTLRYVKHETDVWLEITNLIIPDSNDSSDELKRLCEFIARDLGVDTPVHFSAFHPDFRMQDKPNTPLETLVRAHEVAKQAGLRYPYIGNVHDVPRGSTHCYECGARLIERDWYELRSYQLSGNRCGHCQAVQAGRFDSKPGSWGRKRQPVNLNSFKADSDSPPIHQVSFPVRRQPLVEKPPASLQPLPAPISSQSLSSEDPVSITAPVKLPMLKLDELTDAQKQQIHRATQLAIIAATIGRPLSKEWMELLGDLAGQHVFGLFTTLTRAKQLRGCCGFLGRPVPLAEAILQSTARTAKEDVRMVAISPAEVQYLELDVSLLGSPVILSTPPLDRANAIQIGTHGLRISRGNQAGLLLPSVAIDHQWDAKEFLRAVCRKAGLPEAAWQDATATVEAFDGAVISGPIERESIPSDMPVVLPPGTIQKLQRLRQIATNNLIALTQGGTPSYVALDALDGNVNGLVLTLRNAETSQPLANWIQTSLRPGIALQNSLFELCKNAADTLLRTRFEKNLNIELEITVLYDPVHHGVIQSTDWDGDELHDSLPQCDLEGVKPDNRAIVTLLGDRCSVVFDANKTVHSIAREAALPLRSRKNPIAVFSMQCMSTTSSLMASNAPIAVDRRENRQAAMAGTFYPATRTDRAAMIDAFRSHPQVAPKQLLGLMTPHAGLQFSGAVATKVWEQAECPETLLIIGPKHTPYGSDWAVSPAPEWELPDGDAWQANLELAAAIVKGVEGMQFDLTAHMAEHGIEVQLPILEALLGNSLRPRITAALVRGASWDEIRTISQQLAAVLRTLPELPLLVISSDMNHYQPVEENRRRDELALRAMESCDPYQLLETCRSNSISMCGVVPAAIVMQTLHELGKPFAIERIAYETSADRGSDPGRVVGYAGVCLIEKK